MSLSGDSLVMLEQAAEPLAATDVAQRECHRAAGHGLLRFRTPDQGFVLTALMRPLRVAMFDPNPRDASAVIGAEEDDMLQALLANRADEAFDARLRVRRLRRTGNHLDSQYSQHRTERCAELAVAVPLDVADSQAVSSGLLHERLSLWDAPRFVRVESRGRRDDAPRLDVQEGRDEDFPQALQRQDFLRKKVALPQASGVPSRRCPECNGGMATCLHNRFATDDGEPVPEVHVETIASHMVIMTMAINPLERKPSGEARLRKRVRRELGDAFDSDAITKRSQATARSP